ncbi:MAG: DNA polymerase IV [Anaerolineales bacterium]|nr:MAG: DNA polymerase IV [Anaerolineales bacterium]
MTQRYILHLDVDAFFASVEEILDPSLKGQPLIVGARPEQRGVVASASYAARAFGVRSAMPTAQALRLCPQAIVIPPRHKVYGEYSARMMAILSEYSPLIEPLSLDEAFLDVTGCQARWGPSTRLRRAQSSRSGLGSPEELAHRLQERLEVELGLTASIGLAANKLVAKIASGLEKPRGFVVVPQGKEAEFLAPLPVEKLWGVGEVTARSLHEMGVFTIGQLAELPAGQLEARFGRRGRDLYRQARGMDDSPVVLEREEKSLSREITFAEDIGDMQILRKKLLSLSESVARRLRKRGLRGRTVKLKLRYSDFKTLTRQVTLDVPTDLEQVVFDQAGRLLDKAWDRRRKVRLIGVGVSKFAPEERQLSLFEGTGEEKADKLRRLSQAVDQIREKYGDEAIQRASLADGDRDEKSKMR